MRVLLIFLLVYASLPVSAQEEGLAIFGIIKDTAEAPLNGASVYAENTSFGTTSNAEGYFFLRLPKGGYDLVISYTGYDKQVITVSQNQPLPDTVEIYLQQSDYSLEAVDFVFTGEDPNGLEKYGSFFNSHFIGTTPNAQQCFIANPEVLKFFYSAKRNRLKVTASESLVIYNYALGYRILYQLDSFRYDYKTLIGLYNGNAFFEHIDTTEEVLIQWEKNRAATYLGSRLHFMRAFYARQLAEEGFIVEKMVRKPGRAATGELIPDIYDENLYKEEGDVKHIGWNGRYRIGYKKVWPHPAYLQEFQLDNNLKVQISLAETKQGFSIESNGYFSGQSGFINSGYWSWKKLAELLPYDFVYE